MSVAPPGYETPEASLPPTPPAPQGPPRSHDTRYEFKSVQALRGRVNSAKEKWQSQGWELVSENRGTLRTELNFRRVKPKTLGSHVLSIVATLRRLQPKSPQVLVASCALIMAVGTVGIVVATRSGGDSPNPSAAQTPASTAPAADPTSPSAVQTPAPTAPAAQPTVTDTAVDELIDDVKETEEELDSFLAEEDAATTYYSNCDEAREAGVAPINEGEDGYRSGLDREGDGIACE